MNGVSAGFIGLCLKWLAREYPDRTCEPEELKKLIALLGDAERVYVGMEKVNDPANAVESDTMGA